MTEHISDLRWDQLLAGELSAAQREEAETHKRDCARCTARFAKISAGREAFTVPLAVKAPSRGLRWTMPIAGALAVAAVAMIFLRSRNKTEEDGAYDGTQKGGKIELLLFAGQSDQLKPLNVEDKIFAGDLLQAGYSSPADGYGAVLSLDGAGNASTYVPAIGNAMVLLPAGDRRSFPASTQLDDVLGTERIAVIWCKNALPLEPMLAELARAQSITARENCAIRLFAVDKALR